MKLPKINPLEAAKKQIKARIKLLPDEVSVVILDNITIEDCHWLNEQLTNLFNTLGNDESCMGMVIDVPNRRIERELY